jgi:hypothetical protein
MSSLYDYDEFQKCLFELESALSFIGLRDCKDLQDYTQLSAATYALLRATSLFRAFLVLLEAGLNGRQRRNAQGLLGDVDAWI